MRKIDADALREAITSKYCAECGADENCDKGYVANPKAIVICETKTALDCLDAAPTVEERRGEWVEEIDYNVSSYRCSLCRNWELSKYKYCPNCGAKMDGGTKDGTY